MQCKTQLYYQTVMARACSINRCHHAGQTGLSDLIFIFGSISPSCYTSLTLQLQPLSHTHRNRPQPSELQRQSVSVLIADSSCSVSSSLRCQNTFELIFCKAVLQIFFGYRYTKQDPAQDRASIIKHIVILDTSVFGFTHNK